MPDAISTEPKAVPSAAGGITRLAYARAEQAGVDLHGLLRKAGLRQVQIEDIGARLGARSQIAFLNLVADAFSDDFFGFHLARDPDLREMGLLYYVAASSESVGDALRRAARYGKIVNEGIAMDYRQNDEVTVSFDYVGIDRRSDRHQIEFLITTAARLCWQLAGSRLPPARAQLRHDRSRDTAEIDAFLGCRVEFGAPVDEIVFPASIAGLPVVGADPYLNKLLVAHFDEALKSRQPVQGRLRSDVENIAAALLPHGQARAPEISRKLGMSQRTLARRLSAEDATFSSIVEQLRAALAHQYLEDSTLSISQIAWLLGYQEVSAFTHAFRRWTGKTPRESRAEKVFHD